MKKMCFVRFLSVVLIALFFVSCDNVIPDDSDSVTGSSVEESVTGENQASTDKESEKDSAETESCSHDFRRVPEKAPSCLEDGYTAHEVCALCEEKVGYSVLPADHAFVTVPEKPATEMESGHTEYQECSRCHERRGYVELAATHIHRLTEHPESEKNPLFFTCSCGFSAVSDLRSRPLIDQLTDAQYENFLSLYNMFKNRERNCIFSSSVSQAEAETFYNLIQGMCPELFLVEYENSSFALSTAGAMWNPDCMSEERYAEVCDVMIETMIRWDADCAKLDEVEKIKYMVDWMNDNTVYSSIGTRVRSLYGGIIDREIACVGYSQILAWALSRFEIPCMSVAGFVPARNEGHMWNLVQLDGEWYQVDPGWGNVEFNGTLYTHYAYVNVTDSELGVGTGRIYSDCYAVCGLDIPKCTATAKNVARLEGDYLSSSIDMASFFEAKLRETLGKGEDVFTIVCSDEAVMKSLRSYLQNAGDVAKKHQVELYWFSANHDETTGTYFVSVMLARPNLTEWKLETPCFEEGIGYKLALRQHQNGQVVFFSGNTTGKYLSTVADPSRATDVFFKKVGEGFRLWFMEGYMKKYVDIFVNDSGSVQAGVSLFPTAIYNLDSATGAIVATVNGKRYWLGTYNSYSTIGASDVSYITGANEQNLRVSQFPAELVTIRGTKPVNMSEPPIPVGEGTAYKLVIEQNKLGKKLYFQGWRTRNFPASTTDREKSPNVYLEAREDGYQLYYLWGDNKMYLNVQGYGADSVSIQLQPTPGAPFQYNPSLGLYTVRMYGAEYYIGTYGEYDNFSLSNVSYISGDNAQKIGVTQFPAYLEKVD